MKADESIISTESGIKMKVKFLHPLNAYPPIFFTFSLIVIFERLVQSLNAWLPISVTLEGIIIFVIKFICSI